MSPTTRTRQTNVSDLSFPVKLVASILTGLLTWVVPVCGFLYSMKADITVTRTLQEQNQLMTKQQLDEIRGAVKEYRDQTAKTLDDHTRQLNYLNAQLQQLELSINVKKK